MCRIVRDPGIGYYEPLDYGNFYDDEVFQSKSSDDAPRKAGRPKKQPVTPRTLIAPPAQRIIGGRKLA